MAKLLEQINILVVDDEQIVIDSIKKHLRYEEKFNILESLTVSQALSTFKNNRIDIVITDLMMPDTDGLEFLKIMIDMQADVLAIMITGYATINTALQATQLGAFDYIAKPFTREELRKIVRRAADIIEVKLLSGNDLNAEEKKLKAKDYLTSNTEGIGKNSWFFREEDGVVIIGVEKPFLYNIGHIQTVYLPEKGDILRQGSIYFQIFSADLKSHSLMSPLSGTVKVVNKNVLENPDLIIQEPYSEGWLIKIDPSNFDQEIKLMGL